MAELAVDAESYLGWAKSRWEPKGGIANAIRVWKRRGGRAVSRKKHCAYAEETWLEFCARDSQTTCGRDASRRDVLSTDDTDADMYEGWNFNSGNYLFTTDTK